MNAPIPLLAEYTRAAHLTTHIRPYDNKTPVQNKIEGELRLARLGTTTHWRVLLKLKVEGHNAEGQLCFDAACEMEAILDLAKVGDEERAVALTQTFPGLLTGSIRSALSTMAYNSGYGPLVLPPISTADLPKFLVNE
jgi:preprotein translocase subunit SecB